VSLAPSPLKANLGRTGHLSDVIIHLDGATEEFDSVAPAEHLRSRQNGDED
jgi:hypothetical protein